MIISGSYQTLDEMKEEIKKEVGSELSNEEIINKYSKYIGGE